MTITINEFGEISNPEDFEPPKHLKLKPCHPDSLRIEEEKPKRKRCKECRKLFRPNSSKHEFCKPSCAARYRRRHK